MSLLSLFYLSFRFIPQHGKEFFLRQHRHTEGLCLGQLGACCCAGHNVGRLFGDLAAGFTAVFDDESLWLIAG